MKCWNFLTELYCSPLWTSYKHLFNHIAKSNVFAYCYLKVLPLKVEWRPCTEPGDYFSFKAGTWCLNVTISLWWEVKSPAKSPAISNSPVQLHSCLGPAANSATKINGDNFPVTSRKPKSDLYYHQHRFYCLSLVFSNI